ncbi:MAG TPA: hypothetical protein VEF72_21950 [Mycobacterium sp.]|nr:hypothetical protein [Mycobacterium sp.]
MDYFAKWERLLDGGLDGLIEVLTSRSEEACKMRQNSPFAAVLSEKTRVKVLRSFKAHWNQAPAGSGGSALIRAGLLDVTVIRDRASRLADGTDPRIGEQIPAWLNHFDAPRRSR